MGTRTHPMYAELKHRERPNGDGHEAEIGGKLWWCNGDACTRTLSPGEERPEEAHATTPHDDPDKRSAGYRLAWIFITIVLFSCIAYGLYCGAVSEGLVRAAGVC